MSATRVRRCPHLPSLTARLVERGHVAAFLQQPHDLDAFGRAQVIRGPDGTACDGAEPLQAGLLVFRAVAVAEPLGNAPG